MRDQAPESFENAVVFTKANIYFDGKVVSHTLTLPDGSKKTLGLIYPGSFHFGTGQPELMQIVGGTCRVRLDGSESYETYAEGSAFRVPGNSGFDISVDDGIAQYVCSFE